MKYLMLSSALAALAMTSAATLLPAPLAASETCTVPREQWQPEQALRSRLEGEGWQIRKIKVDDGCYEVYATDKDGKRQEVYFDPRTLEPVRED